jgi:hypothetical protein
MRDEYAADSTRQNSDDKQAAANIHPCILTFSGNPRGRKNLKCLVSRHFVNPLAKVLQVLVSIILQAFSPCPAG